MTDKHVVTEEDLLMSSQKDEKQKSLPPFLEKIIAFGKDVFKKRTGYQVNPKKTMLTVTGIFFVLLVIVIWLGFSVYTKYSYWEKKTDDLLSLDSYGVNNKQFLQEENISTIDDLIQKNGDFLDQNKGYVAYLESLQSPYTYFLRYLYLPSLNIWKDPFTQEIDISLIGQKYIDNNPYEDTKLIEKWKTFFKDVGKNIEFNIVGDITVSPIVADENNPDLFTIDIQVPFVSNSKRSFLLLINKLSMTSDTKNISLINEFTHYLWKEIKDKKKDILLEMEKDARFSGWNEDKIIGYSLLNWVKNGKSTSLIDEILLSSIVKNVMLCPEDMDEVKCYYRFREKYSSLPLLAYTVGTINKEDKVNAVRNFYASIPMLMKLKSFSFDKVKDKEKLFVNDSLRYKGILGITLYGKSFVDKEVQEIALELGKACFGAGGFHELTPKLAMEKIEQNLEALGEIKTISDNGLNTSRIQKIWELKDIMKNIIDTYDSYPNFQKAIKLFETYRMLKDADICEL